MSGVQPPAVQSERLPASGFVLLALVTLFWGANWPVMKIALAELPVWWFRALCVWAGAIGLLAIARVHGAPLTIMRSEVRPLLIVSFFAMLGWQICSAYGVTLMPAGRASITAFTMPVWASLLGAAVLDEPITGAKIAGLILGLAGLGVLMGEDVFVFGTAPLGVLFMLAASVSWAIGTVLFKKYRWQTPVSTLVGWQMATAAVPITIVAMLTEQLPNIAHLSGHTIIALIYTFLLPMMFCQWAFFKVVSMFPASIASIGTLAVPVIGVYSSALVLGEPVGWHEIAALVLICAALTSVLVVPTLRRT